MIQRRQPLKRTALKRSTKPIQRTAVRKRRPGPPRRGPSDIPAEKWRNPGYLKFLRAEGRCVACSRKDHRLRDQICEQLGRGFSYSCDPMHGPPNGKSQKGPDAEAIPGCSAHHRLQTEIGWTAFEERFQFSRKAEAAIWWARYQGSR